MHHAIYTGAFLCALASILLSVNDWLNKWSANNWAETKPTDWNWDEEIVLVTGASGGIGASIVQQLIARNPKTRIIVVDYSPLTWKPPIGTRISYYQCDLSDSSAIKALCSGIRSEVGHPTVLVNNAGLCRGFTVMEGTYHDVELTVQTNLIAPFLLVKEVLPNMVKTNHGHILNVSSMSSIIPPARVADYAATKAGISALHEALQLELAHIHNAPNVRLSLGIFSFIKTPLFKGETRQSGFLFPLLHVDSVGEALVDILYSGYGKTIYMPGMMRYVAMLGRQKVDEKTGRLR
ncbi:hypothetical protein NEMBOFW57_006299 [Staphylotrichum longicolle]|uniref:Uncharacterized protein n=1 Tax=Staphylotrichum longicolle TaxID=669026 RepID=A0AAD4HZC1_9PEZI|nr:hypothetical protein NEMBOFW57_006299 [Staphylotrichum longicolle]